MGLLGFSLNSTQAIARRVVVCLLVGGPVAAQIRASGPKAQDSLDLAIAEVAARQGAWRKSHDALTAAIGTPAACEPRFAAQVNEAREAARRWITSSARAFDVWAVRRSAMESGSSRPVLPSAADLDGLRALLDREREAIDRRKAALTSTLPLERASQSAAAELQAIDTDLRAALDSVSAAAVPAGAPASGGALAASLKPLFGSRVREIELFDGFYAAVEQESARFCAAEREKPEDPFALPAARPAPKREGKR